MQPGDLDLLPKTLIFRVDPGIIQLHSHIKFHDSKSHSLALRAQSILCLNNGRNKKQTRAILRDGPIIRMDFSIFTPEGVVWADGSEPIGSEGLYQGSFSQCAVPARLGTLHPCPHAIVTWSPLEGGTRHLL